MSTPRQSLLPAGRRVEGNRRRIGHVQAFHARTDRQFSQNVAMRHAVVPQRSEEHTSELQSLMRISYAVFCLKKKKQKHNKQDKYNIAYTTYHTQTNTLICAR